MVEKTGKEHSMSTIADTLNDIQKVQFEMQAALDNGAISPNDRFIGELFGFTTSYFFQLCAHTVLDTLRDPVSAQGHPYAEKYYSLFDQAGVLETYILWLNHSGLLSLWNIFERYIKQKAKFLGLNGGLPLDRCFKAVLSERGIENPTYQWSVEAFELIRLTRNSLHSGGIYTLSRVRHGTVCGIKYSLVPGKPVRPIRLLDVVRTVWDYYLLIEGLR